METTSRYLFRIHPKMPGEEDQVGGKKARKSRDGVARRRGKESRPTQTTDIQHIPLRFAALLCLERSEAKQLIDCGHCGHMHTKTAIRQGATYMGTGERACTRECGRRLGLGVCETKKVKQLRFSNHVI